MAKKRKKIFHIYECSLSGEKFKVFKEAPKPEELMSIKAYYELNPEEDDRPEKIKKLVAATEPDIHSFFEDDEENDEENNDN